jgi:hypothetical protein
MTRNPTLLFCILLLPVAGCAVHIPESSPYTSLQVAADSAAESQLLDVAISQFTFEPPILDDGAPDLQLADIRKAESRYMPVMLRHTLTQTEAWGAIHVLPDIASSHDVRVEGEVIESESHTLRLRVHVSDATGLQWFARVYTEHIGADVHSDNSIGVNDPFDGIYKRIANDMLVHVQTNLDAAALAGIRQVAELQFGNEFAPDVYGAYLVTAKDGISSVSRMPPANDPAVQHLQQIRQRDRAFQEVLQQNYVDFTREISSNYFTYRRQAFRELQELQDQQKEARNDMIGGAVMLGVAVATSNIDDAFATAASATVAVAGAVKLARGVNTYTTETPFLDELADSFSQDVVTDVVALEEQVVTLSGSTESIYAQWKEILRELFREDRSVLAAPAE